MFCRNKYVKLTADLGINICVLIKSRLRRGIDISSLNLTDKNFYLRGRRAFRQFIKYCLVGASGFVVNLMVFWLMINTMHAHYWAAGTVSFLVAVTNNFLLNRYWTFSYSERDIFSQAGRFLVISLSSWALNMFMLRLLIEDANLNLYVAQTLAIGTVTVLNFLGNKLWSFRQPTT